MFQFCAVCFFFFDEHCHMNAIFIELLFILVSCLHKLSSNGGCFQTIYILDLGEWFAVKLILSRALSQQLSLRCCVRMNVYSNAKNEVLRVQHIAKKGR